MSGIFSVTVEEARGFVAVPADLDRLGVVIGASSLGSGLSPFFLSAQSAIANRGYGDAVDTLCQMIEQRQENASSIKFPAAMYTVPGDTPGTYGTIDISSVTGTAIPAVDGGAPFGTYGLKVRIINGGALGVSGITYQRSQDNGNTWSNTTALGTASAISIPNSGSGFLLNTPPAQVTAFIAAAVEARADTLAHLADAVAHDATDTSPEQLALAASGVPTTEAQAIDVFDLCRAAFEAHRVNITVHNGPDPVNAIAHAPAASVPTGIALAIEYKIGFNAHLGIALSAAAAGLKAATATLAATAQVFTAADLLDAGEALLAIYPRRPTFATAGATPGDAPSTVTIVGTDYAGAAQTETGLALAQTAATVTATKAFKTTTSITYSADGGAGATIAIGYDLGVHNSADITNTLSATSPVSATLVAGDSWFVRTFGPIPSATDLYDGSVVPATGAFADLATAGIDFSLVVLDFPMTAALAATVTSGINALLATGKRVTALVRTRLPDFEAGETEVAWLASVAADYANFEDSRIVPRAAYGLVTDATTTRQYFRSTLQQFAADVVRVPRAVWPCAPADRAEPNVTLSNSSGVTVGHDEGPRGAATGLSNDTLGNRFSCEMRLPDFQRRESVFNTVPWTCYAPDERIRNLMVRRVANAMERVAVTAGIGSLGGFIFYNPANPAVIGSLPTLTETSRNAVHGVIYSALATEFANDIQNAAAADTESGLVQVSPNVTISGGNLVTISVTLAPLVLGYLLSLSITLAVRS